MKSISSIKRGHVMLASASLIALAAAPHIASAQTTAAPATDNSTVVVVTGFRKSYADAVKMKRTADGITDSISSDGLGRFPDLNVGEALQRVPGVQINREAASRDATINLRGLPGTYARYTIDGQAYADPILDSSTPLGAFNSDVFSAITVIKSPDAADQAGGLSGNIDLRIASALSRKDGGTFKVAEEYDTLGKESSPAFTLGYNKHFSPDFAVFGILAYKKEKFRRDSIYFNAYSPLSSTTTPNFASQYSDYYAPFNSNGTCTSGQVCAATGTGLKSKTGVLYASDNRQAVKYNEGDLVTAAAGMEWKPNDNTHLTLNGFYTRRNLSKNLTDLFEVDMRNAKVVITPTTSPVQQGDGNYYVQGFNYANAQVNDSFRSEPLIEQAWDLDGTAEWKNDKWRLTGTLVDSRGQNNALQTQIDIRNLPTAAGNGVNGSFNSGGAKISGYQLILNRTPTVIVPAGPWTWGGSGNQPTQIAANGDQLIVAGSSEYGLNEVAAAQGDVERKFAGGLLSSLQAGVRAERDTYVSRGYRTSAKGVNTANINSQFIVADPYAGSFFDGQTGPALSNWTQLNYDYAVSQLQPVTVASGDTLTATGWINDPTNASYSSFNFTVHNDISAAYLMGKFAFTVAGVPVHGNAGAHYEQTNQVIDALNKTTISGVITYVPEQFRQKYHDLLPSLELAADLTDDLVLRFADYKTFVRPQPRNLTPATAVSSNSTGYSISYGGYNLKPYTADSQDVSLEWYNRPGGLVSIDFYQKFIHNLIAPDTSINDLCPADATAFGLGHLHTVGTTCYSDILVNGQPAIIQATGNHNEPNTITARGMEFSVQQNLDFLPGFWKNFGGQFNYSYANISGHNPDGSKAVLPGVSKNDVNLIGYYETKQWGARLIYGWRDKYFLTGGSTFTGGQSLVAPRGQLDASVSYNINAQFSVSVDGYNLTDAERVQYQTTKFIPREADYDGRTFTVTLHGSF
jgi:TonB-dependent receptor